MLPPFDPWRFAAATVEVAEAWNASAQSVAAMQARRLRELLAHVAQHSPLYRGMLGGLDPSGLDLQSLPVMHKPQLMRHFDEWVTDPQIRLEELRRFVGDRSHIGDTYLGRYVVWESSGSSGNPAIFVQDAASLAVYDALEALRRTASRPMGHVLDPLCLAERIVFIGAIDGHFASTVSFERLRRLNPWMANSLHSLSFLKPLKALVVELDALKPSVIATYPSVAVLLAKEKAAGRLSIAPTEIWTGGETLSAGARRFVQDAFGCAVCDSYGASEFLALASQCPQGRLHLNSDWAIVESVDAHGRPVPDGHPGHSCLLTNLINRVQPLIRYDLGDRVTITSGPCACGSTLPVIEVHGRSDETLCLGRESRHSVEVLPLALCTVIEEEAGLFDFQVVQCGPRDLLLRTGLTGSHADASLRRACDAIRGFLARQGADEINIQCQSGVHWRRGRSGKVQRIVRMPLHQEDHAGAPRC